MKKNLLTVSLRDQGNRTYVLRLCATFLFSIFCNFHINAALIDSANFQNDQQSFIYVIGSTQIIGASQFSNAQICIIPTLSVTGTAIKNKSSKKAVTSQIFAKKNERDQNLKVLQQKINRSVSIFFKSFSQDREWMKFSGGKYNFSAIITHSFTYTAAVPPNNLFLRFLQIAVPKQKYDATFSCLHFSELRCSPLRGPPALL